MRFHQLPPYSYFVCINPYAANLLLAKDGKGNVRKALGYECYAAGIRPDTEVQQVVLKIENK